MKTPSKTILDKEWRPDLTGYEIYAEMLLDKISDGLHSMSVTDIPKILIEQAIEKNFPSVKDKKKRKIYERLDY